VVPQAGSEAEEAAQLDRQPAPHARESLRERGGTVSHGEEPRQEGVAETWVSAEMGASETAGSDQGRYLFPPTNYQERPHWTLPFPLRQRLKSETHGSPRSTVLKGTRSDRLPVTFGAEIDDQIWPTSADRANDRGYDTETVLLVMLTEIAPARRILLHLGSE
jgi:hypothetical protein